MLEGITVIYRLATFRTAGKKRFLAARANNHRRSTMSRHRALLFRMDPVPLTLPAV